MAILNITLPEGASICHGKQVTFRAPCDCVGVTGLKIGDVTYSLVDTSDNLIDRSNAFVSGAMVTTIIDEENKKAYIQSGSGSSGGSCARKVSVTLLANAWDEANSQIVNVTNILADETSQLIHIMPEDEDAYVSAGIDASVETDGKMKFVAETKPSVDLNVVIVIEDIGAVVDGEVLMGPESKVFFADVPVNWTQSGNFYYQDIAVPGMSEKFSPIVNCQYGNDQELNAQYKDAFGLVHDVDTFDGSVRIWCTGAPTMEFTVKFTIMGWYQLGEDLAPAEGVEF